MILEHGIHYIGVNDYDIRLFEGQYHVPNGMAYNSYIIADEKTAVMDTVDKHFSADKCKKNESYPMIYLGYILLKLFSQQPAYERHKSLKSSEKQTDKCSMLIIDLTHFQSLTD